MTDVAGHTTFSVVAPLAGDLVLPSAPGARGRQGADEIGWFPSFPTYFNADLLPDLPRAVPALSERRTSTVAQRQSPLRPTASQTWGWGASLWDYDWGFGEDFDSKPYRGTWLDGHWLDTSDGTGRAVPFNGGLVLQSKLVHTGDGDLGTTTATLQGSAQQLRTLGVPARRGTPGRRARGPTASSWSWCRRAHPTAPAPRPASWSPTSSWAHRDSGSGCARKAAGSTWSGRDAKAVLAEAPFNMAVEVGKKHITWFRDAKPIFTLKGRKAQLGVPLVPRYSLVGQQEEMNGAQVDSDWQRAFSLAARTQVTKGEALARRRTPTPARTP